jgi:hypothetical protein
MNFCWLREAHAHALPYERPAEYFCVRNVSVGSVASRANHPTEDVIGKQT